MRIATCLTDPQERLLRLTVDEPRTVQMKLVIVTTKTLEPEALRRKDTRISTVENVSRTKIPSIGLTLQELVDVMSMAGIKTQASTGTRLVSMIKVISIQAETKSRG